MLTAAIAILATLAAVGALALAFFVGVRHERRQFPARYLEASEQERRALADFDPVACAAAILGPICQNEVNMRWLEIATPANSKPV
ncbi:MAG: hypothetical protein ACREV7_16635 [Steroidobacteraceae bacterium]